MSASLRLDEREGGRTDDDWCLLAFAGPPTAPVDLLVPSQLEDDSRTQPKLVERRVSENRAIIALQSNGYVVRNTNVDATTRLKSELGRRPAEVAVEQIESPVREIKVG